MKENVKWSYWLSQDELNLADACCLLFEFEPYGIDLTLSPPAPACPPEMDEKRYKDMKSVFYLALIACDNFRYAAEGEHLLPGAPMLASTGPRHQLRVKMKEFLRWIVEHNEDVCDDIYRHVGPREEIRWPSSFASLISEVEKDKSFLKKSDRNCINDYWLKAKKENPKLKKKQGLLMLKKYLPNICEGKSDDTILDYMKTPGNKGGRPKTC